MDEKKRRRLCVLVTGVGGRSVGCQILHALLLSGEKYRVVAVDADAFSYGLYQVKDRYLVPRADSKDYLSSILKIVENERVDIILPGTEPELEVLAANQDVLIARKCAMIVNPPQVVALCSNKWRLYNWLKANGIRTPKTEQPSAWRELVREAGFPIVGKPAVRTGGSRGVAILKDEKEVEDYLAENREAEQNLIFQEYLCAEGEEYTVGVLISKIGEIIDSIVIHRKLTGLSLGPKRAVGDQSYVLSTGYSQGFVVKHPTIQQCCESLALKLGSRGPLNIQGRLVNGEFSVFEVHPRFSGTSSIRAEVGFNEVDVLIRNFLFDEKFERLQYRTDAAAIRAFCHSIVSASDLNSVRRI